MGYIDRFAVMILPMIVLPNKGVLAAISKKIKQKSMFLV